MVARLSIPDGARAARVRPPATKVVCAWAFDTAEASSNDDDAWTYPSSVNLYPIPYTVKIYRGSRGSRSIFRRMFLMWASMARS